MIRIRRETPQQDLPGIRQVIEMAFPEPVGAGSYEHVRYRDDIVSLVAVDGERIVGNALFTPVTLEDTDGDLSGMGLLLLAVHPEYQRDGIGRRLTHQGLEILREKNCPFVIVIGVAAYYPRIGFKRGSEIGFQCQWDGVEDASFMAMVLDEAAVAGKSGVTRYVDEFR